MWLGWIDSMVGIWLIVSTFIVIDSKTGNLLNDMITGIILLGLWVWADHCRKNWQRVLIMLVGGWMIIAGFRFPSSYVGNMANDLVAGCIVIILGFWMGPHSMPYVMHFRLKRS